LVHVGYVNYRDVDREVEYLNVVYPGGFEKYCKTPPGGVFTIGGESGAGKTTYCLNFIRMNDHNHKIAYISTELNRHELREYLRRFEHEPDDRLQRNIEDWKFEYYEAIGVTLPHLVEKIIPDYVNVIDWIQMVSDDYPNVSAYISAMKAKVGNGLLVVVLQKDPDKNHPRGRYQSVDPAYLAIMLGKGERFISLKVAKIRYLINEDLNPERKSINVQLVRGSKLRFDPKGFRFPTIMGGSTEREFE
jgi:ABC-type oligopeptide transport system ATPase subunit